jgi:fibrillarin-like rRNA methylase
LTLKKRSCEVTPDAKKIFTAKEKRLRVSRLLDRAARSMTGVAAARLAEFE